MPGPVTFLPMPRALSLFAGAGGGAEAARRAGYSVLAVERDRDACETLSLNGFDVLRADIKTFDFTILRGLDLLIGGPPCQPFSQGGKNGGQEDKRDCIPDFMRAVKHTRPRVFVMENVRGLTFAKHAEYLQWVLSSFPGEYQLDYRILNAADYGVPQTRQRLFLVGRRDGHAPAWPVQTHSKDAHEGTKPWVTMAEALSWGLTQRPALTITAGGAETGGIDPLMTGGSGARRSYAEAMRDPSSWIHKRPATTIVGSFNPEVVAAPGYRTKGGPSRQNAPGSVSVSVSEAAALQGYPAGWHFAGSETSQRKQIGNACPPAFIGSVIEAQIAWEQVSPELFTQILRRCAWDRPKGDTTVGAMLDDTVAETTRCYVSQEGRTGFGITESGDLTCLFNIGPAGRGQAAVAKAIELGARTLNCFEPFLPAYYERLGWHVERWEDNWTPGGPRVAYMRF